MIQISSNIISESAQRKVTEWLMMDGKTIVIKVVRGNIARLQVSGSEMVMNQALPFLSTEQIPPGTVQDFKEAAQWQIFLDKLEEISRGILALQFVEVKVRPTVDIKDSAPIE